MRAIQTVIVLDTQAFWLKLCDPLSVRTSHLSCQLGETVYLTLEAPEDNTRFQDLMTAEIDALIGGDGLPIPAGGGR